MHSEGEVWPVLGGCEQEGALLRSGVCGTHLCGQSPRGGGQTEGGPAQERGVSFGKSPCRQRTKLTRLFLTVFPSELKFSVNVLELG